MPAPRPLRAALPAGLLATALLIGATACADERGPRSSAPSTATPPTPSPSTGSASSAPPPAGTSAPAPEPRRSRPPLRGVDASHHQGTVDWDAVAGSGIRFAYLKASEGSTFTDPEFAANAAAASEAGLRVAGYHYFSLCTPGADQAAHFLDVLATIPEGARTLPPAIDLELVGSCDTAPARRALLTEVRAFLEAVERGTGREPVVYLYPDFERAYGLADDLAGHRQWVRSLGTRPDRDWWMWQKSASATIPGIAGPADLNLLKRGG